MTIHENPITAYGWTGSGYLIIDPYNGTGAYKIGGGMNGAQVLLASLIAIFVGLLATTILIVSAMAIFYGAGLALLAISISVVATVISINQVKETCEGIAELITIFVLLLAFLVGGPPGWYALAISLFALGTAFAPVGRC